MVRSTNRHKNLKLLPADLYISNT